MLSNGTLIEKIEPLLTEKQECEHKRNLNSEQFSELSDFYGSDARIKVNVFFHFNLPSKV